ncbi:MAG: alpha/beta hydrolase [Geoalkalibacter sp.]|uniref:alpha/beta hydrolase n=1 Tax=Geoalkalibacter sp. TaxID=3041440 RepID=UPI002A9E7E7E|nr:alpha/beta fold hydrolase [Thermodesulfobacteriota bacterium]
MFGILVAALLFLAGPVGAKEVRGYDYPFDNPLEATVVGTPDDYQPELPEEIPKEVINIKTFVRRSVPKVFWYEKGLDFSLVAQPRTAPLIFLIAGTGADYNSGKMVILQRAFYKAGFHVISLSSPTHMNFIISSSETMVPGDLRHDSRDLYRAMALAWQKVRDQIDVSAFHLAGYSLGAAQAPFVTQIDDERQLFNFEKVMMINPPVDLFKSVRRLDLMLEENIPGGPENFNAWFRDVMNHLVQINRELDLFKLSEDALYTVYKHYPVTDDFLAALIGISFRISAANMVFTSDVMHGGGYLIPPGVELSPYQPLEDYFIVAHRTPFGDYFREFMLAYYQQREEGLTGEELQRRQTLQSIGDYLRQNPRLALMHNRDDIIVSPEEIDWLEKTMGERARIYPHGGHCGNMAHYDNLAALVAFFTGQDQWNEN